MCSFMPRLTRNKTCLQTCGLLLMCQPRGKSKCQPPSHQTPFHSGRSALRNGQQVSASAFILDPNLPACAGSVCQTQCVAGYTPSVSRLTCTAEALGVERAGCMCSRARRPQRAKKALRVSYSPSPPPQTYYLGTGALKSPSGPTI